jgi:hypothetical protein
MKTKKTNTPSAIVGRTLARDAVLLARVAAPDDAEIARKFALALRDPERVARLLEGLLPDAGRANRQIPA